MSSEYLHTYLRDHHAGATGGLSLAQRIAGRDDDLAAAVAPIAAEIEEDKATLEDVMGRLGVGPNVVKDAIAKVGEVAGRLKLNQHLLQQSPLSPMEEVEALSLGVLGKGKLWVALKLAIGEDPRLAGVDLDVLAQRAWSQHDRLEELRVEQARDTLSG
jgi:hypothetical protein